MRCLLVCVAAVICVSVTGVFAQSSDLPKKNQSQEWYFGQGLTAGDEFVFEICDYTLRIPQSYSPCYVATLRFVTLLPTSQGQVWIVSAHISHGKTELDMVIQHTKTTHRLQTDAANIPYANSLQRTLSWISGFANEHKRQILDVGKSWGQVASGTSPVHLTVNKAEQSGEDEQTYILGYGLAKDSYLQVRLGSPFPLKAKVYKPVFLQEQPLLFAFQLLVHRSTLEMCNIITPEDDFSYHTIDEPQETEVLSNGTQTMELSHDVQKIDEDVAKLLKEKYGQKYMQKIGQATQNFTRFIEIISEVIDSQLNSTGPE
ncbi:MAG: hypothetical protein QW177_07700 [Candidatus Nitrosotenuis sp.]